MNEKTYTIEELSIYNGDKSYVCQINSKEEYSKLKKVFKRIANFEKGYNYYLLSADGLSRTAYYNTIKFSQIDFQETPVNLLEQLIIW